VNRGDGRDLRTGGARSRLERRSEGAFASSRPEGGNASPLTISFTKDAAKVSESSGQDCWQTRSPVRPHRKNGRMTSKREPPLLKWKLTSEKSLPTSSGEEGAKARSSAFSFSSSSDPPGRPTKKTGIFSAWEPSSLASKHVLGALPKNMLTFPPTSRNRLKGRWKTPRPSATRKTGMSSRSPAGSNIKRRDWRSAPIARCLWVHLTQASSEPPRAAVGCGVNIVTHATKASEQKPRRKATCGGDVIGQERIRVVWRQFNSNSP